MFSHGWEIDGRISVASGFPCFATLEALHIFGRFFLKTNKNKGLAFLSVSAAAFMLVSVAGLVSASEPSPLGGDTLPVAASALTDLSKLNVERRIAVRGTALFDWAAAGMRSTRVAERLMVEISYSTLDVRIDPAVSLLDSLALEYSSRSRRKDVFDDAPAPIGEGHTMGQKTQTNLLCHTVEAMGGFQNADITYTFSWGFKRHQ